jgi:GTP-binding protein HflX
VRSTLAQVGGGGRAELLVMNKIDLAPPPVVARLLALHPEAGAVSAATGAGLDAFLTALDERLAPAALDLELLIPHQRSDLVAALHRVAEVFAQSHEEAGVRLEARLPAAEAGPFLAYTV